LSRRLGESHNINVSLITVAFVKIVLLKTHKGKSPPKSTKNLPVTAI
jgi:hypothetical protein